MIVITTPTRQEAAAVVQRALEFVCDVKVTNVSGTQDAWNVEFDSAVVMDDNDLIAVRGNNAWRASFEEEQSK